MGNEKITHRRIDKYILIKTFKRFKRQPKKVFVASDFSSDTWKFRSQYLNTLIMLGLIKEVSAIYKSGDLKKRARRTVKGYKLKW